MNPLKYQFGKTLFASSAPLIIGGVLYVTESLISGLKSGSHGPDSIITNMDQSYLYNPENMLRQMRAVSLSAYDSYFRFMVAMFIINLVWKILTLLSGRRIDKSGGKMMSNDIEGHENSRKPLMKQLEIKSLMISILFYTIAYLFIQTISFLKIDSTPSLLKTSDSLFASQSKRVLTEEDVLSQEIITSDLISPEKISFSIARTLSSLDFPLSSIILSRDETLAFVTIQTFGTLKIINISDLQYPVVKASLDLARPMEFYGQKSLLIAPDEKTLFVSNFKYLEIVDVSDPLLPRLLGTYNEKDLPNKEKASSSYSHRGEPLTTLALSKDQKILFIGGLGLEIFDVSDTTNPRILFKKLNTFQIDIATLSSVTLSADGRNLFLANGTLDVFEVSDPKNPKMISSWEQTDFLVSSVFLSDDNKTAYVAGNYRESEGRLEQVDISNLQAPAVIRTTMIALKNPYVPFIISASPGKTQLYIAVYSLGHQFYTGWSVIPFDLTKNAVIYSSQSLIKYAYSIVISADGKKAFAATLSQFVVFELFANYPNSQILSLSKNQIGYFKTEAYWSSFIPSADNKIVYVSVMHPVTSKVWLEIWNITNRYSPSLISSYKDLPKCEASTISSNYQRAFFLFQNQIFALDISDVNNLNLFATYQFVDEAPGVVRIQASQDSNILYVQMETFISIIDFSDATQVKEISRIESSQITLRSKFAISPDEKALYLVQSTSEVYDITDKARPRMLSNFSVLKNEPEILPYSVRLSPDSKTLFTELFEVNRIKKLRIFNVSDPSSITLISETLLPMYDVSSLLIPFEMTPDAKTGYVFQQDKMLALNIADLAAPTISGVVPILNGTNTGKVTDFILGSDGKTAFAYNTKNEVIILDLQLKYTLFLNQEKFLLGKKYSDGVMLFSIFDDGGEKKYTPLSRSSLKFLTLSLLDFKIIVNKPVSDMKFSALPPWISFDPNNQALTVDAKRESDLGNYTLYSTSSEKISLEDFSRLDFVKANKTILRDLVTMLQGLSYIDNELYLTSRFGDLQTFYLTAQFQSETGKIYDFLKRYFIETSTRFEVKTSASLSLTAGNKFVIQTPNMANVRVEIILHSGQKELETEGQFILKLYASLIPAITEKKSRIKLEGPLDEVNQALEEIVVNYEKDTWCSGEITLVDNMNPPITRVIGNISKYFQRNERPKCNPEVAYSVQEQAQISPIYTGQYFTINLNKSTFRDEHIEELNYNLMMAKEPRELPDWMIFEDLVIKGTPPEQVLGRDIELVLQVKNEFKTLEVSLSLHINISSTFILKLIMKYAPYILTVVGLLISANKVYNILAQKRYKHRKEFEIEVGEEVTPEVFYPISFIGDEKRESKLILNEMLRGYGKAELLRSFMTEEQQLDKQKIVEMVKKVFLTMSKSNKKLLRLYQQPSKATLINKIIINELIKWQIDSKEEKETKVIFEKIKNQWVDFVDWDLNTSGFVISPKRFDKVVMDSQNNEMTQDDTQEESLIQRQMNIQLLKDAVLVYAFEDHNIEKYSILVEVTVKQRVESNFLFRFLKLDLKDLHLNEKSKLDYGINYKIKRDTLNFYGIPDEGIEGKTLVVQITNLKRRILKEIWIHGVSKDSMCHDFMSQSGEIDIPL